MGNLGIDICDDGHRCENGSLCVENPIDENNFFCDCDEADVSASFAGLFCEHKATVYCTTTNDLSRKSFCTNGGSCKSIIGKNDAHLGCFCQPGYEGSHCQFVTGTKPKNWPSTTPIKSVGFPPIKSQNQMGGITIFFLIVVTTSIAIGIGAFVARKRLKRNVDKEIEIASEDNISHPAQNVQDEGLTLEPDGGNLRNIVLPDSTPPPNANGIETFMDDQVEIL